MPSFVVETYVPSGDAGRFAADVDGLREAAVADGGAASHIRSYLAPGDEMGFHVVEAASIAVVARVAALAGVEAERVVPVIGVGFDTQRESQP